MKFQYLQQIEELKKRLDDGTLKEEWVVCEEYPNYEVSNA